jgi:CubicO group peptidase (beta-lactamase class C family)
MMNRILICLLLILCAPALARCADAPAAGAEELVGLWQAKRWFGPFARGPLVIRRAGSAFTASMLGQDHPVRVEGQELSFELPNGQGAFRARLPQGGAWIGHWYPPRAMAMGGHVTPVRLEPDGKNRWRGEIVPFDDIFTFYLLAQKRPDGMVGALLRNPERDFGAWLGVERMVREGNAVKLMGKRPGQKDESEAVTGTYDPENRVITLGFPGRGGSYDFRREGDGSDFYPRGRNPARYSYRAPPARDDGWPVGTLDDVDIDRAGIERLVQLLVDAPMDSALTPKVHALFIVRHGKLVLEEYFHGENRERLHETRSAAKSVTAVVVGAAIEAGVPLRLSTPVYEVMAGGALAPDPDPRKRSMTLEHLLTMSAGYFCDDTNPDAPGNEDKMQEQEQEPDWYRYTLAVPLATPPGEKSVYCSSNPNLALGMVGRAAGESPLDLFDRLVAAPLGITRYGWPMDPAGNPYGGGGVQLLPRDFLKFGQLMLNGGTWQGRRILSREFAARATTPLYHLRGRVYGYLWWGIDYPYKDRTVHAYYAGGAGGQAVMVIPFLDLVIGTLGANYSSPGTFYVQTTITPRDLLPCVREAGDDKRAPVVPRADYTPKIGDRTAAGPVSTSR